MLSTPCPPFALTPPLHAHLCMPCISINCSWPILVCRPFSMQGLKGAHKTLRSFATSTIRRRLFGGATRLTVFLHRCASPASHIACPRTLLTSCCVRAWQDRSRDCLQASPRRRALSWPPTRALRDGVRHVGVRSRCEKRSRCDRAICSACSVTFLYACVCTGSRVHCRASA